jgi:hypothetical protein
VKFLVLSGSSVCGFVGKERLTSGGGGGGGGYRVVVFWDFGVSDGKCGLSV